MKRIFISHPFANDPIGNKQKVDKICKNIAKNEKLMPVSPLHLFGFMEDDSRREEIMEVCFDLIEMCEEVWFFYYDEISKGQLREHKWAEKLEKKIKMVPLEVN